jgi:hypothetical protein
VSSRQRLNGSSWRSKNWSTFSVDIEIRQTRPSTLFQFGDNYWKKGIFIRRRCIREKRWIKFCQILRRRSFRKFVILSAWHKWFLTQETKYEGGGGRGGGTEFVTVYERFLTCSYFTHYRCAILSLLLSIICQKQSITFFLRLLMGTSRKLTAQWRDCAHTLACLSSGHPNVFWLNISLDTKALYRTQSVTRCTWSRTSGSYSCPVRHGCVWTTV